MNTLPLLLLFLFIASCSTPRKGEEKRMLAQEDWKGHNVADLKDHPYFKFLPVKKIPHEDGIETWVLKDQSKFQTGAYCQTLGGCMGMPQYNCDNAFSVKNDVILGYEQSGGCPGASTIEPRKK
jgi:hypothetical protein